MTTRTAAVVKINRAPVLTLWAAVVARRLDYEWDTALTLGKAVAGLNAQSKGRHLGLFTEPDQPSAPKTKATERPDAVAILGRQVPISHTAAGVRATAKGQPIQPDSVQRYLNQRFGADLSRVQAAMEDLASSFTPRQLAAQAYALYEQFRPAVPEGTRGWGAKGELDLQRLQSLRHKT
jgi:hypothetical protein